MVFLRVPSLKVNLSVKPSVTKVCFCQKSESCYTIIYIVYKQYETEKYVMMEMQRSLKSGKRSSLSLDEYSSLKNKRYLNINVHQDENKFLNLGMLVDA